MLDKNHFSFVYFCYFVLCTCIHVYIEWTQHLKWTPPHYTFCSSLYQDYLTFDCVFQS